MKSVYSTMVSLANSDPVLEVRKSAIKALGDFGIRGREAREAIRQSLVHIVEDRQRRFDERTLASEELIQLQSYEALSAVIQYVDESHQNLVPSVISYRLKHDMQPIGAIENTLVRCLEYEIDVNTAPKMANCADSLARHGTHAARKAVERYHERLRGVPPDVWKEILALRSKWDRDTASRLAEREDELDRASRRERPRFGSRASASLRQANSIGIRVIGIVESLPLGVTSTKSIVYGFEELLPLAGLEPSDAPDLRLTVDVGKVKQSGCKKYEQTVNNTRTGTHVRLCKRQQATANVSLTSANGKRIFGQRIMVKDEAERRGAADVTRELLSSIDSYLARFVDQISAVRNTSISQKSGNRDTQH